MRRQCAAKCFNVTVALIILSAGAAFLAGTHQIAVAQPLRLTRYPLNPISRRHAPGLVPIIRAKTREKWL
jgi:hypothetical protein